MTNLNTYWTHVFLPSKIKTNGKKYFSIFPYFLKLFHQKVWVKYQLGVLKTCSLVKNLITNIRTKVKGCNLRFFRSFSPYGLLYIYYIYSLYLTRTFWWKSWIPIYWRCLKHFGLIKKSLLWCMYKYKFVQFHLSYI